MAWLYHPAYVPVRDRLARRLKGRVSRFKHLRQLVFICGGRKSQPRARLRAFLKSEHPAVLIFYAETVWDTLSQHDSTNALHMEEQLALLSDLILILVESEGTIAELGAFASHPRLRQKLVPIIDLRFETERSFINTGPIAWVDAESRFGPTIYTHVESILAAAEEISARIDKIPSRGRLNSTQASVSLSEDLKRILFFLCDLVAVIGPATESHCRFYVEAIFGQVTVFSILGLLALGHSLGLLQKFDHESEVYFSRPLKGADYQSFLREDLFDVAEERARMLSTYQGITEASQLMQMQGGQ